MTLVDTEEKLCWLGLFPVPEKISDLQLTVTI